MKNTFPKYLPIYGLSFGTDKDGIETCMESYHDINTTFVISQAQRTKVAIEEKYLQNAWRHWSDVLIGMINDDKSSTLRERFCLILSPFMDDDQRVSEYDIALLVRDQAELSHLVAKGVHTKYHQGMIRDQYPTSGYSVSVY